MKLPIELIPNTSPFRFRWQQTIQTFEGPRIVNNEGAVPAALEKALVNLITQAEDLQRFKDWVHAYLDAKGVPPEPMGKHGAHGCRIGDRLDWVFARLEEQA